MKKIIMFIVTFLMCMFNINATGVIYLYTYTPNGSKILAELRDEEPEELGHYMFEYFYNLSIYNNDLVTVLAYASNTYVTVSAGTQIRILPGFHAAAGSRFQAKIEPPVYFDVDNPVIPSPPAPLRASNPAFLYTPAKDAAPKEILETAHTAAIAVYPNPASNRITVKANTGETACSFYLRQPHPAGAGKGGGRSIRNEKRKVIRFFFIKNDYLWG